MSNGFVLKDAEIKVNSTATLVTDSTGDVDLSDHVISVTLNMNPDTPENTSMGDANRTRLAGLKDLSVDVQFLQDYNSGSIDATLYNLVGGNAFFLSVMPNKTNGIGTTNPLFRGLVVIGSYQPVAGNVGDVSVTNITFQAADSWSRFTAVNSAGTYS